jgi:hypothetical protein
VIYYIRGENVRKSELLIGTKEELLNYFRNDQKVSVRNNTPDDYRFELGEKTIENQLDFIYNHTNHFGVVSYLEQTISNESGPDVPFSSPGSQQINGCIKLKLQSEFVWIQDKTDEERIKEWKHNSV